MGPSESRAAILPSSMAGPVWTQSPRRHPSRTAPLRTSVAPASERESFCLSNTHSPGPFSAISGVLLFQTRSKPYRSGTAASVCTVLTVSPITFVLPLFSSSFLDLPLPLPFLGLLLFSYSDSCRRYKVRYTSSLPPFWDA